VSDREPQDRRIIAILGDNRWHCSNEFVAAFMPRFSAVIHTLRHRKGWDIEGVPCTLHQTKDHSVFMFRIKHYPAGMRSQEQLSWL
jgi:hypothetical protein